MGTHAESPEVAVVYYAKGSAESQLTSPSDIRRRHNISEASDVGNIPPEDGVKLVPMSKDGIASLRGVVAVEGAQDFSAIRRQVVEARRREDH